MPGDQRITTRYREADFLDAMMATVHEVGHASYEAGLPAKWAGLPVGRSRNMCIHESQSLLFEKQILLSRPFGEYFSALVREHLPAAASYSNDQIWAAMAVVQPGYIRVEADEVTYPLHVLLRYEIESALINDEIQPADIPQLWDQKMRDYLDLSTGDDHARGCLQDIHWSDGTFGYFPSYTLGAVNASQLFSAYCQQHSDWTTDFAKGDTSHVRGWLADNIWSKASMLDSQQIMVSASGENTGADYLLNHLRARYLEHAY